jgi:hypothetical protein
MSVLPLEAAIYLRLRAVKAKSGGGACIWEAGNEKQH